MMTSRLPNLNPEDVDPMMDEIREYGREALLRMDQDQNDVE